MCCYCFVAKSCLTVCNPVDCSPPGSSVYGISQAGEIGAGCHFLLQGIFLTKWLNPCLLLWQVGSLPLSHLWSPYETCIFISFQNQVWGKPAAPRPHPNQRPRAWPWDLSPGALSLSSGLSLVPEEGPHILNLLRDWRPHTRVMQWHQKAVSGDQRALRPTLQTGPS